MKPVHQNLSCMILKQKTRQQAWRFLTSCVRMSPPSPPGDQLCLGARWLPAIYGEQVWSHHRLQQSLHQHHSRFPW